MLTRAIRLRMKQPKINPREFSSYKLRWRMPLVIIRYHQAANIRGTNYFAAMRWFGSSTAGSALLLVSTCSAFLSSSETSHPSRALSLSSFDSSTEEPSDTSRDGIERSPWAASKWKFTFNIGREPGTLMPDGWGKQGGRLVFDLPVQIASDRPSSDQLDPMLQRNSFRLNPLSTTKFISMAGEQECVFGKEGGWKIRLPIGKASGEAAKLMCFVDLKSDIEKNDVSLKSGERIYLTAKSWREEELERALNRLRPIHAVFRHKQKQLTQALEHETGDRRLDGTDPIQTIIGMKDTAQLVIERDEALRQYQEANTVYPTVDPDSDAVPKAEELQWQEGPWVRIFDSNKIVHSFV